MAIPATHNLEALLERTKQEAVASWIDALPQLPSATDRLDAVKAIVQESYERDRDQMAGVMPLGADNLIGSYFRAPDRLDPNAEAAWLEGESCATIEGVIVAQPFTSTSTAIYLVEFYGEHGATGHQELVELEQMLLQRWAFYDNDAWLKSSRSRQAAEITESTEAAS